MEKVIRSVMRAWAAHRSFAALWCRAVTSLMLVVSALGSATQAQTGLRVVATLPDFASIARSVGGEAVDVTSLLRGGEDPHFVEPRPSFVKVLSQADVLVVAGMDLEIGYLPPLLQSARNAKILPGAGGYVDCSRAITPLEVPSEVVDRSMGDVHPWGNPHYWLDPLNGVRIAAQLAHVFATFQPEDRSRFEANYDAFRRQIAAKLVGESLVKVYSVEKLALLYERGGLEEFLRSRGELERLAGWLAVLAPYRGVKAVDDHNMWPYFARRFGLEVVGHMEPKPGIAPTTSHLQALVERMRAQGVRLIFSSPYYDPKHARFLAQATGARIVPLAHVTGSRPGTDDYIAMVDYNVNQLRLALESLGLQREEPGR